MSYIYDDLDGDYVVLEKKLLKRSEEELEEQAKKCENLKNFVEQYCNFMVTHYEIKAMDAAAEKKKLVIAHLRRNNLGLYVR